MGCEITDNGIDPAPLSIPQPLQVPTVSGIYVMVQDLHVCRICTLAIRAKSIVFFWMGVLQVLAVRSQPMPGPDTCARSFGIFRQPYHVSQSARC